MSATTTPPLAVPLRYDPMYKVNIRLHEPLLSHGITQQDVRVEMLALCEQFDVLCRHELAESSRSQGHTNVFHNKVTVVEDKMSQIISKVPYYASSVQEYLERTGLGQLYPRVSDYLSHPTSFSLNTASTCMQGYFSKMSAIHQLYALASQISSDAQNLSSHKYMAHQLALLYQTVNSFGESPVLEPYKKSIEENFKPLKASLVASGDSSKPVLPEEIRSWLLQLTSNLYNLLTSFPPDLTQCLTQPALLLSRT